MSEIRVTAMEPLHFGVQVTEGDLTTSHRVQVPPSMLDDLGLSEADASAVVRETIGFLLDREPATSIMDEFSLDDVSRFFPDYLDELSARLAS
ncbi:MAG: hypothetical protein M3P53_09870 [Actinomycetota bacterium]|jgi:hypothetical protein|nr:hypothetical protein [Actinomycetota bacterium]